MWKSTVFIALLILSGCISPIYTQLDDQAETVMVAGTQDEIENAEFVSSVIYPGFSSVQYTEEGVQAGESLLTYARNVAHRAGGDLVMINRAIGYAGAGTSASIGTIWIDIYKANQ